MSAVPVAGTQQRDGVAVTVLGAAGALLAVVLAAFSPLPDASRTVSLVLGLVLFFLAQRVEFRHRTGSTVATQSVLVGMFFTVPLQLVPVVVLLAQLLVRAAQLRAEWVRSGAPGPVLVPFASTALDSWICLGPVLVLLIAGSGIPRTAEWPLYLLALLVQFAVTVAVVGLRAGTSRVEIAALRWTFALDAVLALTGLGGAVAGAGSPLTLLFCAAPVGLLALVIGDRRVLARHQAQLDSQMQLARDEARLDPLTGLGNRRAWREALDDAQLRPVTPAGVLILDLNNLKLTNDTLGHDVGDALILAMGRVLTAVAPAGAVLCRLGGDEFAVLLPRLRRPDELDALEEDVRAAIDRHPPVSGVRLSAALGTAATPPAPSLPAAIRSADALVIAQKRADPTSRRGAALRVVGDPLRGEWPPRSGLPSARRSPDSTEML